MRNFKLFDKVNQKTHFYENEIPNETTIKAMEEENLFSAESAEEMITDCLDGDESWKNSSKSIHRK
jgi:hypothetical protein